MSFMDRFKKQAELDDSNVEVEKDSTRYIGKIIFLQEDRGWGFIASPDKPFTRIFFHWSALVQPLHFTNLTKGMKVEFFLKEDAERGWRAVKIRLVPED